MSSLNLNKVVLCGRLTADPELKQTQSGVPVVSFTLAINRRYQGRNNDAASNQPTADFISVVAWRQTAEFISKYFRKGSSLCVTGSIQTRNWQDQQGQKRYATEVVADEAELKPVITKSRHRLAHLRERQVAPLERADRHFSCHVSFSLVESIS